MFQKLRDDEICSIRLMWLKRDAFQKNSDLNPFILKPQLYDRSSLLLKAIFGFDEQSNKKSTCTEMIDFYEDFFNFEPLKLDMIQPFDLSSPDARWCYHSFSILNIGCMKKSMISSRESSKYWILCLFDLPLIFLWQYPSTEES